MHLYLVDTHLHSASPFLTGSRWSGFVTFFSNHGAGACFHEGISEAFVRSKAPRESVGIQRLFKLPDTKGYLTHDKIFVPGSFFRTQLHRHVTPAQSQLFVTGVCLQTTSSMKREVDAKARLGKWLGKNETSIGFLTIKSFSGSRGPAALVIEGQRQRT